MDTLELIIKPCQSGKTFIMLQEIAKMLENDDNNIHIIFCDNQLLQTQQTSDRIEKSNYLEYYRSDDGDVSVILSSQSKIREYERLTYEILFNNRKTIVTCSNKKRVGDINNLIKDFAMNKRYNDYNFCIWIDEADKNVSLFENYLKDWDKNPRVSRIGLITATPENLLKKFKIIKIFQLEKSHDPNEYHSFSESEFKLLNLECNDIELYLMQVLKNFKNDIKNGQVWFIPGEVKIDSHNNIKDILLNYDFNVLVINGEGKTLYSNKRTEELKFNEDNLADFLGNVYNSKKLYNEKIAITGNLCISRGITINNKKMIITHAVLPPNITNRSNSYQLAGRICGNIKKFKNYSKPTIYCTQKFKNIIFDMENRAKNLAEKAFNENIKNISLDDYKQTDNKEKEDRKYEIFNNLDDAKIYAKKHFNKIFNRKNDDKAPQELLDNDGNNPSFNDIIKRWWGISDKSPIRLIPTNNNKWVIYWRPSLFQKNNQNILPITESLESEIESQLLSETESDNDYKIIKHKEKEYYLDGKQVFRIKKDGSKGKYYGSYCDGNVKKTKTLKSKTIIAKSKK